MKAIVKVDLTEPDGSGNYVEIDTPAGTVRVYPGMVEPLSCKPVVVVEFDRADGWTLVHTNDEMFGKAKVTQVKEV